MRKFRDLEFDIIVTEDDLRRTFEHLQREHLDEYDYSFENYIRNCVDKNGTLEEIPEVPTKTKNIRNKKGTITMKGNYTETVEVCPHCERENNTSKFHTLVITKGHIENIMNEVEHRINATYRDCQGKISEEEARDMRVYIQTGVYATLMAISSNWSETVRILDEEETKRKFWNI